MVRDLIRAFFRPAVGFGLGDIASIVGIGSGLNNLFGGGNTGAPNFTGAGNTLYTPTGAPAADQTWQQMLSQIHDQGQGINAVTFPQILQSYMSQLGINQQPLVNAGAQAGQQFGNLATTAGQYGNTLGTQAGNLFGAGQDIYNLGRDPMNQTHDFLQQQTVDNSRAATSARGVGMSPYAAGVENDATRNFNMDWQNQLLGRASTGLTGMENANRAGATDLAGSLSFGAQAPAFMMESASLPINAQSAAYGAPGQFAGQYAGQLGQSMLGPEASIMQMIMPYLNYGQGAMNSAANFGMAGAGTQNQLQTQGLERILGGMQNLSGPGSWLQGFGSGNPSGVDPYGGNQQMYQQQFDQGFSMPG